MKSWKDNSKQNLNYMSTSENNIHCEIDMKIYISSDTSKLTTYENKLRLES
jgi:hypothetical protein